jgi:cytochrome o ubiquinol oxidase operon protein cyoD
MNETNITLRSYMTGFFLSVLFTLAAFFAVTHHARAVWVVPTIIILAFLQLITQLIFFLHLSKESKPRWNLFIFFTTIIGIAILVLGSLWIMNHLNYNMTSQDMSRYLIKDEGMQK